MSEIIENIGSAMTLCEYVMLNGRETNWRSVHETLRGYALEDTAVEELPETSEEDYCYVSIRETLIDIVNMFRLGGGYKYTDSGVVMLIRLFTKLDEELMDIVDPDDIEEDDYNLVAGKPTTLVVGVVRREIDKILEMKGGVDIMETPSALTAICEYIIINGVKSDWDTVYDALRCLRIGDKKVEADMSHSADGPFLEDYVSSMYRYIFNLYNIWGKDSWVSDGYKYSESKEDMIALSEVCHFTIDYLYEYVYDEEE